MRWLWLSVLLLSGCVAHFPEEEIRPDTEQWAPPKVDYSLPDAKDGSVFRPGYMLTLFKDKRAYREGDILTVSLNERTSSSKQAATNTSKKDGMVLGLTGNAGSQTVDTNGDLSLGRSFNGNGSSSQRNQLTGSITVTVTKVLPNGTLLIRGEKWLRLNQGDEYLRLLGLIRSDDIDNSNTISSQRIADARILYGGKGAIADSNAMGWAARYFNSPWFPL